jgi:quercetin dioxygenase-like cupin family protein
MSVSFNSRSATIASRYGRINLFAAATMGLAAATSGAGDSGVPQGFVEARPADVQWRPHPSMAGGKFAVLVGKLDAAGPLVVRVKLPSNAQFMPHTHPEARTYTVISGEWKLGFGAEYEETALRTYPPGSMYRLPAQVPHFQSTGAEGATVQIESIGPTRTEFLKQ